MKKLNKITAHAHITRILNTYINQKTVDCSINLIIDKVIVYTAELLYCIEQYFFMDKIDYLKLRALFSYTHSHSNLKKSTRLFQKNQDRFNYLHLKITS